MLSALLVVSVLLALGPAAWFYAFRQATRPARLTPRDFLRKPRPGTRIVCVGDSITHGRVSADYVEMLRQRFRGEPCVFVNAGVNSDLSWTVRHRIDEVIACQPDVVTILVGTNDLLASVHAVLRERYRKRGKIPRTVTPSVDLYAEQLTETVSELRTRTSAKVALSSPPILGEDPEHPLFTALNRYRDATRQVCEATGADYLPCYDRQLSYLRDHPRAVGTTPADLDPRLLQTSIALHYLGLRSWDRVAARNGLHLTTECVHMSERGAAIIADVIEEYIGQRTEPAGP